jgi:predicted outer membrane repeat protein
MKSIHRLLALALFAVALPLQAATITVDTLDGSGGPNNECALTQAVLSAGLNLSLGGCAAGSASGTDTIVFDPTLFAGGSATINLDNPLTAFGGGLVIEGPSNATLVVNGDGSDAVMTVNMSANAELTLRNFALNNGVSGGPDGAGIRLLDTNAGDLVLEGMNLGNHVNQSSNGGAIGGSIENDIRIEISETAFDSNSAAGHGGAFALVPASGASVTLVISDVTFSDNEAGGNGGALFLQMPSGNASLVQIHDARFEDNLAGPSGGVAGGNDGGGIWISGLGGSVDELDIQRTRFSRNIARGSGGAIAAVGVLNFSITQSVFESNNASRILEDPGIWQVGGAVDWRASGTIFSGLLIKQSTFEGNYSRQGGGAVITVGGDSLIVNSTFDRNTSDLDGGQALRLWGGVHELLFNTLTDNERQTIADFTIRADDSASVALGHNIVWTESGIASVCAAFNEAAFTSLGYNLAQDASCAPVQTDLVGADPMLGPLHDYGDSAAGVVITTRLPAPDSPVVDGGAVSTCPGPSAPGLADGRGLSTQVDQRGRPRPVIGDSRGDPQPCDIGAVEYQPGQELVDDIFRDRFEDSP